MFYLSEYRPTGDRVTRFVTIQTEYATEAEAVAAFKASRVKRALVREMDDDTLRVVCKR